MLKENFDQNVQKLANLQIILNVIQLSCQLKKNIYDEYKEQIKEFDNHIKKLMKEDTQTSDQLKQQQKDFKKKKKHEINDFNESLEFLSSTSYTERDDRKLSTIYEMASNLEDTSTVVDLNSQFDQFTKDNSLKKKEFRKITIQQVQQIKLIIMNRRKKKNQNKNSKNIDYEKDQQHFQQQLQTIPLVQISNPIKDFQLEFQKSGNKITLLDQPDFKFLVLEQMRKILRNEDKSERYIDNILCIHDQKDIRNFLASLYKKKVFIEKVKSAWQFRTPNYQIYLQKKGKMFHKNILKPCFITNSSFGQLKSKDSEKIQKPDYYIQNQIYIQTFDKYQEIDQKLQKRKSQGIKIKKQLKWLENKEIAAYKYRILFEKIKDQKTKAIYFQNAEDAINLKNTAIIEKMLSKDSQKSIKFKVNISLWKILQAQYFYQLYLQKFLDNTDVFKKVLQSNKIILKHIRLYIKDSQSNIYESTYQKEQKNDFYDNTYLDNNVKENLLLSKIIDQEKNKQQQNNIKELATIVNPDIKFLLEENEKFIQNKQKEVQYPFQDLDNQIQIDENQIVKFRQQKKIQMEPAIFKLQEQKGFIDFVFSNSILILNLEKILIENYFHPKRQKMKDKELENLKIQVKMQVEDSLIKTQCNSYVEEQNPLYISFKTNSSLKLDINGLQKIQIILQNTVSNKVIFDKIFDIRQYINDIQLLQNFLIDFDFEFNKIKFYASFVLNFVMIPRNLESSHVLLNQKLIDSNFKKFAEIIRTSIDYKTFIESYYQDDYKKSLEDQQNLELYLNNQYPLQTLSTYYQNIFYYGISYQQQQEFGKLLDEFAVGDLQQQDLFQKLQTSIQNEHLNFKNPFYDYFCYVSKNLGSLNRAIINELNYEMYYQKFVFLDLHIEQKSFNFQKIKWVNQQLEQRLKNEYSQYKNEIKQKIQRLVFWLYIQLESNQDGIKQRFMYFSDYYIDIVIHIVCQNKNLKFDQQKKIIINTILQNKWLKNFTYYHDVAHIGQKIFLMKLWFKKLYPSKYQQFLQIQLNLDQILTNLFFCQFANIVDSFEFNLLNDFKQTFQYFTFVQKNQFEFIDKIQQLNFSICEIIDILLLIICFSETMPINNSNDFINIIKNFINTFAKNLLPNIGNLMQIFENLTKENFYSDDYMQYKKLNDKIINKKFLSYNNLQQKIQKLKVSKDQILKIIKEEFQKEQFISQVKNIYVKNEEKDYYREEIFEDAYFEVTKKQKNQQFENNEKEIDEIQLLKMYLQMDNIVVKNIDYRALHSLNKIQVFDIYQIQDKLGEYFGANELLQMEIYNDLSITLNTNKISFLYFIIIIVQLYFVSTKDQLEIYKYLLENLTKIFNEENQGKYFDQLVTYLMNQLQLTSPIFQNLYKNLALMGNYQAFPILKQAFFFQDNFYYDISQYIQKHYFIQICQYQTPVFYFSEDLTNDLEIFLQEEIKKNDLNLERKLKIIIEFQKQDEQYYLEEDCLIEMSPGVQLVCKNFNPIYFEQQVNNKSLVDQQFLQKQFNTQWINLYNFPKILKRPFQFMDFQVNMKFKVKRTMFMMVNVKFELANDFKILSNLIEWKFNQKIDYDKIKFKKKNRQLILPYEYSFLNFEQFSDVISQLIIERMDEPDILLFIQLNTNKSQLLTAKEKVIQKGKHFFDMSDFDNCLKNNEPFVFYKLYDAKEQFNI